MDFFNSFLLAIGKLVLGVIMWLTFAIGGLSNTVVIKNPLPVAPVQKIATSSIAIPPAASGTATTTPKKTAPLPKEKTPIPLPQPVAPIIPQPPVVITNDSIAQTNTETRLSVVNILCNFRTTNTSSYISGSGLMVDSRGVVLTNAHVAQFFLLQNYPYPGSTSCTVRTGSPATPAYTATLLYLPPMWIQNNASQILSNDAMGTGERDYAFLYITGPAQFAPTLPSSFSSLAFSIESPKQNDPVLLAGYPAGFLDASGVQRSLYISSAVSTIQQLYTFNSPTEVDVVSLGGTVISQSGSSGGAVINLASNKLVGLIATESTGTTTASRDLRAITLSYINTSLTADGKGGIALLLSGDLLKISQDFSANVAPALTKQLISAIEK
jgi:hypothetical protein